MSIQSWCVQICTGEILTICSVALLSIIILVLHGSCKRMLSHSECYLANFGSIEIFRSSRWATVVAFENLRCALLGSTIFVDQRGVIGMIAGWICAQVSTLSFQMQTLLPTWMKTLLHAWITFIVLLFDFLALWWSFGYVLRFVSAATLQHRLLLIHNLSLCFHLQGGLSFEDVIALLRIKT